MFGSIVKIRANQKSLGKRLRLILLLTLIPILGFSQYQKNDYITLRIEGKLKETEGVMSNVLILVPRGKTVRILNSADRGGVYKVKYNTTHGKVYVGYMSEIYFGSVSKNDSYSSSIPAVPIPTAPANLIVTSLLFDDRLNNGNNILDGYEKVQLKFTVENKGRGDAYKLVAIIKSNYRLDGLIFPLTLPLGNLKAGVKKTLSIPISGSLDLETGKAELEISITEGNGFDADPFKFSFETQAFKNPILAVADYKFTTEEGGDVNKGEVVSLSFVIQNKGQGVAKDININVKVPSNVYPAGDSDFSIYELKPNESKYFDFDFFANKKYSDSKIPVEAIITEGYGKYGITKVFSVELGQSLAQTQLINVTAQYKKQVDIDNISLTSDVDKNIPINNRVNENVFALIIGNEDYSSYQRNISTEVDVAFANNDALIFKEYCVKTFGVPEKNITLLLNATSGKMNQEIDKLNKLIKATNGKAKVVVYYAGHGLPDEVTKIPYLIPVDVSGSNITSGIKLSSVYEKLTEYPSQQITVFIDACFSGGARDQGLLATRGVRIKPKKNNLKGNIVVFTASSGEESSLAWKQKQHGMFTYFLLKKFQSSKGDFSYAELDRYLKDNVGLESVRTNSKSQNPQVLVSPEQIDNWGDLELK